MPPGRRPDAADAPDAPRLLAALRASDPGRPRLTWYGAGGERVELSARVLATWLAKSANLLAEELDVAPGDRVRLDLPPHWRTVVLALAAGTAGADLAGPGEDADVVVAVAGSPGARRAHLVVALEGLARTAGHVPPGAVDYNAAVGPQPDDLLDDSAALPLPATGTPPEPGARVLLPAAAAAPHPADPQPADLHPADPHPADPHPARLVEAVLSAWRADGSVVLVGAGGPTGDALEAVAAQERVTARA